MKSLNLILPLLLILTTNACKRVEGCKDKHAQNYNADATKDCKCCNYQGTAVFWCDQATVDQLQKDGSSVLTYYVNDVKVAEGLQAIAWSSAPECGQKYTVTIAQDLGGDKSKPFTYRIEDAHGSDLYIGSGTFEGNLCVKVQLK